MKITVIKNKNKLSFEYLGDIYSGGVKNIEMLKPTIAHATLISERFSNYDTSYFKRRREVLNSIEIEYETI